MGLTRVATAGGGASAGAPYGISPISAGRSGMSSQAMGARAPAQAAMISTTVFHPPAWARAAKRGRNTRLPVAALAVKRPVIRPRWETNQRFTTVAPSTMATPPLATPDITPQVAISCQGWVMKALSSIETDIRARATVRVRRTPNPCIRAAAKGPTMP